MNLYTVDDVEYALKSRSLTVRDLYTVWELRQPVPLAPEPPPTGAAVTDGRRISWLQENVAIAGLFTERAAQQGEWLLTCDAAREILHYWRDEVGDRSPDVVRVCMSYATALTRLGFTRAAREELQPYSGTDVPLDVDLQADVYLLLGDILREESHHATSHAARLSAAAEALQFYERALAIEPDRLRSLGLTAAMSLLLGERGSTLREQAELRAQRILDVAEELCESDGTYPRSSWARAVAQTVLGDAEAAAASYREMQSAPGFTTQDLADARHRAQFHAEAIGKPRDFFNEAFPPLQLIVFAGDRLGGFGEAAAIPAESIEPLRTAIRAKLDELDVRVGLVCPAAGADLLFIEALLERNGIVHIILPWSRNEFRETSVRRLEPAGMPPVWEPLFERAINEAATIREIGQAYEPASDVGWEYMFEVTAGIALHTARAARLDVRPMTVRCGRTAPAAGVTNSFVEFWRRQLRQEPIVIDLPTKGISSSSPPPEVRNRRSEKSTMRQEVKSILFADIAGYSKLPEKVIPEFVDAFLGKLSQLVATSQHVPRSVATWGDAVHAIFDFTHEAGNFALEIIRLIEEGRSEWLQKGLFWQAPAGAGEKPVKNTLSIRIGLHTGPVFVHYNPVIRQIGYTGAHVSRAARIEPVAGLGEVFVSEEFAALAELAEEVRRRREFGVDGAGAKFVCEYAGSMQLAKNYPGRHRIYRLIPKREFAIEELAKAVHELYFITAVSRGETSATNKMLVPWDELPVDVQDANRAQVLDIPNKLRLLGYELASYGGLSPAEIRISQQQLEELGMREHDRWMNERRNRGWTYAPVRDNSRKLHPLLVSWERLSEADKEKDRDVIRNIPDLIERAGLKVRKISRPEQPEPADELVASTRR
jgi:class 3 adenylate cyclase/tetratricopeptide (TPR) repeat protein